MLENIVKKSEHIFYIVVWMLVGNDAGKGEFKENWLCNKYSVAWLQNVKHEVLFEALQAGSEDKAAHSKFTLASLAKKEVFVLMFFF